MPTAPDANPANEVELAKSLTATARTVAANGFAIRRATTVSHQRRVHDFVRSHGISMMATGAVAASTRSANDRNIIEHIRTQAANVFSILAVAASFLVLSIVSYNAALSVADVYASNVSELDRIYSIETSTFPKAPSSDNLHFSTNEGPTVQETVSDHARQVSGKGLGAMSHAAEWTAFLIESFGSAEEVARLLGVESTKPIQWRDSYEIPGPQAAQQLLNLHYVVAKALLIWPAEAALDWLNGSNSYLEGARPIDVLKRRGTRDVVWALEVAMV